MPEPIQHNIRFTDDEVAILRAALMARINHLTSVRDNVDASVNDALDIDIMVAMAMTLRERLALVLV